MKKLLILCLTLSVMTGVSFAANLQDGYRGIPVVCDSSDAPDDFGYTWVDSDNGGSPPFNWFDITTIGTEVEGLADDNNVGPISMGFNFPYYWYEVNRMWIGSNGYISFSSGANFAHPFADIPFRSQPNDLIAVLAGDLDFSRGNPSCYYWSNNTDSFVVSWLNVGEFGYIDSLHNCQVVFDATDSSVTFYYGEQHGDFFDSNGENRVVIGMENATGNVGLQYLRDNAPPGNMYHDGLALRFHPDPDPTFEAHDLGTYWVFNEGNGAKLHATGNSSVINGLIKNFGTVDESDFIVTCQIKDPSNTTIYNDTITIDFIAASATLPVHFDPLTPEDDGEYRVEIRTRLSGDEVAANDRLRAELRAVPFEEGVAVDIAYDDGEGENGRSWNGEFSGFGNEFASPYLPMQVHNVQTNVFGLTANDNLHVWVMDDDGTGNPNEILAADTVLITSVGWETTDFTSHGLTIPSGKVFAVAIAELQSTITFGMDETPTTPFSFRGWEYTGGLAGDRDRETSDVMIRINGTATPTSVDNPTEPVLPADYALGQNYPNPFNPSTRIDYSVPVNSNINIEVFNIIGQKVKTLVDGNAVAGNHSVTWNGTSENGSKVSSGVYFYRLSVEDEVFVKRMTFTK